MSSDLVDPVVDLMSDEMVEVEFEKVRRFVEGETVTKSDRERELEAVVGVNKAAAEAARVNPDVSLSTVYKAVLAGSPAAYGVEEDRYARVAKAEGHPHSGDSTEGWSDSTDLLRKALGAREGHPLMGKSVFAPAERSGRVVKGIPNADGLNGGGERPGRSWSPGSPNFQTGELGRPTGTATGQPDGSGEPREPGPAFGAAGDEIMAAARAKHPGVDPGAALRAYLATREGRDHYERLHGKAPE